MDLPIQNYKVIAMCVTILLMRSQKLCFHSLLTTVTLKPLGQIVFFL